MERIVVGVDGSPSGRAALRWAVDEAERRGATLVALTAYDVPIVYAKDRLGVVVPDYDELLRDARVRAEEVLKEELNTVAVPANVPVELVAVEALQPAAALVDRAKDATMLVVGTRGRGGFAGLLLGSVSQHCVHHAPCPVVVVRGQT
jgi:nucleotide-binding universal stress UspA family protein